MDRQRLHFPVEQRYRVPGPGYKLGDPKAGELHVEIDSNHARYLTAKQVRQGLWSADDVRADLEPDLIAWLTATLRREHPRREWLGHSADDLVAQIQEDLVLLYRGPREDPLRARAVYVNVNFPSGWCPHCAVGQSFLQIHGPVPNVDEFGGAGRRTAAASLFGERQLVRFVWTLIPEGTLDRRHCHRATTTGHGSHSFSWSEPDEIHLRVERQVVVPLSVTTCCFLIRVYHYPMSALSHTRRQVIRESLASMPEEVRRYKGLPEPGAISGAWS